MRISEIGGWEEEARDVGVGLLEEVTEKDGGGWAKKRVFAFDIVEHLFPMNKTSEFSEERSKIRPQERGYKEW